MAAANAADVNAVEAAVAGMVVKGARVVLGAEKAGAVAAMQLIEAASA